MTNTLEILYLDVICPRCRAPRGTRCSTTSGAVTQIHADRRNPIDYAYGEGYADGRRDGDEIAARKATR